jgi:hypothetical protein
MASSAAVLIEGPKACGKTETASQRAASSVYLDVDQDARQAAQIDPGLLLEGARPRLIDEWQLYPRIWDHVRRDADASGAAGQFLLTGSSSPADDARRHSGAGRIATVHTGATTVSVSCRRQPSHPDHTEIRCGSRPRPTVRLRPLFLPRPSGRYGPRPAGLHSMDACEGPVRERAVSSVRLCYRDSWSTSV